MNAFHESEQFSISPLMCLRPGLNKVKGSEMRGVQELVTISAYFQGDDKQSFKYGIGDARCARISYNIGLFSRRRQTKL